MGTPGHVQYLSLSPASLALQLAEHPSSVHQMVVEDAARYLEQLPDGRVSQRVPYRQALFLRRHNALVPENGELLRHDGLVQIQSLLQFLNRTIAPNQDFENLDANRVRQCPEELCFEGLKLGRHHQFTGLFT
jgi:hypothetical protein